VTFEALAATAGRARVRMTVTLGAETDAFEMPLLVRANAPGDNRRIRRNHRHGDRTVGRAARCVDPSRWLDGEAEVGTATFRGRSTVARHVEMPMSDLLKAAAAAPALSISRTGTGRLYYTARLQHVMPEPREAVDRGIHVGRRYERYVKDAASPSTTTFGAGDLIRVRVTLTLRGEGQYLALTDPISAGLEPIEGCFQTTARDLARTRLVEQTTTGCTGGGAAPLITSRTTTTACSPLRRGWDQGVTSSRTCCARRRRAPSARPAHGSKRCTRPRSPVAARRRP
jgi:hypothetical protein